VACLAPFQARLPLKQRVRYTMAMTVCVAAVCREADEPRIALCSDTRLDYGTFGSTNKTVKCDVAGHGWTAMLAGRWDEAQWLFQRVQKDFSKLKSAPTKDKVAMLLRTAGKALLKAAIFDPNKPEPTELLLAGFESDSPALVAVSVYGIKVDVNMRDSFWVIGSGASIAFVFLTQREYSPVMSQETAAYLIYEAKKASQKDSGVGKATVMVLQAPPDSSTTEDRAKLVIMNDEGLRHLEEQRTRFGLQPLGKFDPLPGGFFVHLTK